MLTTTQQQELLDGAKHLCTPNNTITTLELKLYLRKKNPGVWVQQDVSDEMRELSDVQGIFDCYDDNGTFRTYTLAGVPNVYDPNQLNAGPSHQNPSTAAPKPAKVKKVRSNQTYTVDRKDALELIENSNGLIFNIKPQNLNLRLKAYDTPKGYLTVFDMQSKTGSTDAVINMQSITEVRIGGDNYIIQ